MDSRAPISWRCEIRVPKNKAPTASIHTGMLEPTKVTLIGMEVCSAMY